MGVLFLSSRGCGTTYVPSTNPPCPSTESSMRLKASIGFNGVIPLEVAPAERRNPTEALFLNRWYSGLGPRCANLETAISMRMTSMGGIPAAHGCAGATESATAGAEAVGFAAIVL